MNIFVSEENITAITKRYTSVIEKNNVVIFLHVCTMPVACRREVPRGIRKGLTSVLSP